MYDKGSTLSEKKQRYENGDNKRRDFWRRVRNDGRSGSVRRTRPLYLWVWVTRGGLVPSRSNDSVCRVWWKFQNTVTEVKIKLENETQFEKFV